MDAPTQRSRGPHRRSPSNTPLANLDDDAEYDYMSDSSFTGKSDDDARGWDEINVLSAGPGSQTTSAITEWIVIDLPTNDRAAVPREEGPARADTKTRPPHPHSAPPPLDATKIHPGWLLPPLLFSSVTQLFDVLGESAYQLPELATPPERPFILVRRDGSRDEVEKSRRDTRPGHHHNVEATRVRDVGAGHGSGDPDEQRWWDHRERRIEAQMRADGLLDDRGVLLGRDVYPLWPPRPM